MAASEGIAGEVLTKDNYDTWSVVVRNYLVGLGLWDVVESVSEIDDKDSASSEIWRTKNAKALHIIQLSCGSDIPTQFKHLETAKDAWNYLTASFGSELKTCAHQGLVDDSCPENKPPLHSHVEKRNWVAAKSLMERDESVIFSTSSWGRTALHVAVIARHRDIVEELVRKGKEELVKMQDNSGYTALALAADLTDNIKIAMCMVEREGKQDNQDLLTMKTKEGEIPVLLAATKGHIQMTRYLYTKTPLDALVNENAANGVSLLTRCITAEIFDVALRLLQSSKKARAHLHLSHESASLRPLHALANKPLAFPSGTPLQPVNKLAYCLLRPAKKPEDPFAVTIEIESPVAQDEGRHNKTSLWGRFCGAFRFFAGGLYGFVQIFGGIPDIQEIYDLALKHHIVLEILRCMSDIVSHYEERQLQEASAYDAMLDAAKNGIIEFIDSMRKANPELLWATDQNKRSLFSHAILNRKEWVFPLINALDERKELITSTVDVFGDTLLHQAAHLGPSSYLVHKFGPALQMQSEIQFFKAVDRIVLPVCKEAKNAQGLKPRELFTEKHKDLMQAAEKWTKETVNAFALVATVMISIMFAAAITVPGGLDEKKGTPIFLNSILFTTFIVADAVSLVTASMSILFFIGIITSRYAEKDFRGSVTSKLVIALGTLLVSVMSMTVAFCAALAAILKERVLLVTVIFALISGIPIALIGGPQLGIIMQIFNSLKKNNIY